MEFKESQIPDDAINAKEIDSIAKFLAHVSVFSPPVRIYFTHLILFKIDWSEAGIRGLIVFHVLTFLIIITTRKRVNFQGTLFAVLRKCCQVWLFFFTNLISVISIGLTEKINEYLANNNNYKKLYFTHQYFDSHGMFISLLYSAPALVNCVLILVRSFGGKDFDLLS